LLTKDRGVVAFLGEKRGGPSKEGKRGLRHLKKKGSLGKSGREKKVEGGAQTILPRGDVGGGKNRSQ